MNLLDLPEQLLDKIEPEPMSGCWLWTGCVNWDGYGTVGIYLGGGRRNQKHTTRMAHRLVYELLVGPIGKPTLDHICRVRCCVNPDHLRPATMFENVHAAGSTTPSHLYSLRDKCPKHGCELRPAASEPRRRCPECKREYFKEYYRTHREYVIRRTGSHRKEKRMADLEKARAYDREYAQKRRERKRKARTTEGLSC